MKSVVLSIPRIDRYIVDQPLLPCKIIEKTKGKSTSLYAIPQARTDWDALLESWMSLMVPNELNLVEADFPELDNIPSRKLSLREAAKTQSVVDVVSGRQTRCMCKRACLDSRCSCRKAQQKCNIHCHKASSNCQNSQVYVL